MGKLTQLRNMVASVKANKITDIDTDAEHSHPQAPHQHMAVKAEKGEPHTSGLEYTPSGKEVVRPIDVSDAGYGGKSVSDAEGGEANAGKASKPAAGDQKMPTLVTTNKPVKPVMEKLAQPLYQKIRDEVQEGSWGIWQNPSRGFSKPRREDDEHHRSEPRTSGRGKLSSITYFNVPHGDTKKEQHLKGIATPSKNKPGQWEIRHHANDDHHAHMFRLDLLKRAGVHGRTWYPPKDVKEDADELDEAVKLNSKVRIHAPGKQYHGQVGYVGEIRHGAYKGAPKTYTVDYGNRQSIQLDKSNIRLHKAEQVNEAKMADDYKSYMGKGNHKPGWMLRADPKLAAKFKEKKKGYDALRKASKGIPVKEQIEQIDEMPGANMDTRAVHSHLKKHGWLLARTSGGHDVYTHPNSPNRIAVPRHKQLKAPLVKSILKQSTVHEEVDLIDESKIADKIRSHPAVDYYGGKEDHHFINLKPGYWHRGLEQRSFANNNASEAHKELKHVEKIPADYSDEYKPELHEGKVKVGDFVKDTHGKLHRVFDIRGNTLHTAEYRGKDTYGSDAMLHKTKAFKASRPTDMAEGKMSSMAMDRDYNDDDYEATLHHAVKSAKAAAKKHGGNRSAAVKAIAGIGKKHGIGNLVGHPEVKDALNESMYHFVRMMNKREPGTLPPVRPQRKKLSLKAAILSLKPKKSAAVDQLDELSKEKLRNYIKWADDDHIHQNMARRHTTGVVQQQYARKEAKRKKGISMAYDKLDRLAEDDSSDADT